MSTLKEILDSKGSHVYTINPEATVLEAADLMNQNRIGALCVVEQGVPVGMFTERDLLNRVICARRDPSATPVAEVMSTPVIACGPHLEHQECAAVMSYRRIRHVPITEEGKLVGLVSSGDLMARQATEKQAMIDDLYEYLHGRK
jgi:CBS domain-containing protein